MPSPVRYDGGPGGGGRDPWANDPRRRARPAADPGRLTARPARRMPSPTPTRRPPTAVASGRTTVPRVDGAVGRTFGDYVILERLGAGGMGVVYRALQSNARRLVALKLVKADWWGDSTVASDRKSDSRFRNEAQCAGEARARSHRADLRGRPRRGRALLLDAADRRAEPGPDDPRGRAARPASGRGLPRADRPGRAVRPRPRHRAPRRQALEYHGGPAGPAVPDRPGPVQVAGGDRGHQRGRQADGHGRVHVARAGPGRSARRDGASTSTDWGQPCSRC